MTCLILLSLWLVAALLFGFGRGLASGVLAAAARDATERSARPSTAIRPGRPGGSRPGVRR